MTQAQKAETLARFMHFGQTTKSEGLPYVTHIERVAGAMETDEEKAVAWLHDLVEDCEFDWAEDRLRAAGFSEAVVQAVLRLTRGWHVLRDAPYVDYISDIAASGDQLAIRVKLADLRDNMRPSCPDSLRRRYEAAVHELQRSLPYRPPATV